MYQLLPSSVPYAELQFFLKIKKCWNVVIYGMEKVKYKSGTWGKMTTLKTISNHYSFEKHWKSLKPVLNKLITVLFFN